MATELGSAFISVGLGTNTLAGDIRKAFGSAESSGADAGKSAGKGFGGAFGIAAAALGTLGIGSFFKSAVDGAAGLEQSMGAVSSVFKGSAGQMQEWSQQAATDVGLSANEFNELGTLIGSQLKNGGTAMDELAPKTKSLISTGADLASMFGGTTSEAVAALSSALKGERDPIERYGVSLNQAKIDAEAASLGFAKVNGAFDQSAQQAATLSLITKQTADATGNFGRETDTLAHKQQVLNAQLANGKARIGTELLPVVAAFTGLLSKALGPAINGTVAGIKTVVGGFTAFGAAFKAADGDVTSSGFAGVMERIGFAAREVTGGIHAMFAAYKAGDGDITSSGFAGFMERVGFGLREVTGGVQAMFAAFKAGDGDITSSGFAGFMEQIGGIARTIFDGLMQTIGPLIPQILSLASAFSPMQIIFAAIQPLLPQLGAMFMQLASVLGGSLLTILTALTPMFIQLSGVVSESLGGVIAAVLPTIVTMITMLGATLTQLIPIIVPIIATLVQLATTLISQLMPIITNLVASILPPLVDIFGNILSAIGPVITMVASLLIPIIQALMPVVVTVFGVVADVIKSAMQIVQGIIQVVTGIISGDWGKVWEGIQNIFGGIWNAIVAVIGGAIKIVWSVISSGLGMVGGFIGDTLGNIGRFFSDTWNNVTRGISDFVGGIGKFFESIPGTIQGALSAAGSWLYDSGKNIVQGLFDGIKSLASTIGSFFLGLLPGWIVEPFKIALGIHSPSRVFRGLGVNIGEGLILGIDDMHGDIGNAVTGMVTVPSAPSFGAGSYTPAGAIGSGRGNTFNTTINQVDDPIGTSHAVQRRLGALAV